jgi:hypothetical protein
VVQFKESALLATTKNNYPIIVNVWRKTHGCYLKAMLNRQAKAEGDYAINLFWLVIQQVLDLVKCY